MRTSLLCFLIPLLCTSVRAQTGLSLSDAIQQGLANNYQIRLAKADEAVARNNDDLALTGKRPTISLGISPGISYRSNTNPASIVSQSSTLSYSVAPTANLSWTIFNGGRIEITKEQLSELANLSAGQLQVQVETSIANIINAYYNAVVAQKQIEVLKRVLDLSRDRITYQEVRSEFGQAGTFEMLQANDAFFSDSTSLIIQETAYGNALRNLLQLMGEDDLSQDLQLITEIAETNEPYDRQAMEAELLAANSQLEALRINQRLAAINTALIETEYKPSVSFNAGANYDISVQTGTQTFDFGGDQPPREQNLPGIAARTLSGNIGVSANYLIFDGGARNVRKQTAKLQEITSTLNLEATSQQLRAALQNTLDLYDNQINIVDLTRGLIANAERNIEVAEERFRGGTINSFDYRQIQLQYVNAEFQLLSALLNLKNTETELLRLTGGIVD